MKALITGASSGIGREFAIKLSNMGYDLILVSRRKTKLEKLKKELNTNVEIIPLDISSTFNCTELYNQVKKENIDILINNAGFGECGLFEEIKLDHELDMIDTNIKAVHTLTELFLKDFTKRNSGYILNVASTAAFFPGPLMATYYSTKAYILSLTEAISEELKHANSKVYIGTLCPGPVNTEFNDVAKVKFAIKAQEPEEVVNYAIKKMFKRKLIIVPGITNKLSVYLSKILPLRLKLKICYNIQSKKQ